MNKLAACIFLAVGLMLMVFMMVTESEPGALPWAMVLAGATWCWRARVFRQLD